MANLKARRKLSDLYKTGVEVRFGPGPDGEPVGRIAKNDKGEQKGYFLDDSGKPLPLGEEEVAMWVQPASPLQREMALRDAQASRARALVLAKRNHDSVEHLTIMAFLADMSDDTLFDYVLAATADTRRNEATREILGQKEWEDVTSIQDALRQFEEMDPAELEGNPEYEAIMDLDIKFGDQVRERELELLEAEREVTQMLGREKAEKKALDKRSELVGSQAFMSEYERQMTFYSVRDPDNTASLWFESARELAEQPDGVLEVLREALTLFIQDGTEAKNLQGVASGLESSEPPSEPGTSEASTPEASNE